MVTVSAFLVPAGGEPGGVGAAGRDIAAALIARPEVVTARVSQRGYPAVYRVDVRASSLAEAIAMGEAAGAAAAAAASLAFEFVAAEVED